MSKAVEYFESAEFKERTDAFVRAGMLCEHIPAARMAAILDGIIIDGKVTIDGDDSATKITKPKITKPKIDEVGVLKLISSYVSDLPKFLYAEIRFYGGKDKYWFLPMKFDGEKILQILSDKEYDGKSKQSRVYAFTKPPYQSSQYRSKVEIDEALAARLVEAWYRYRIFGQASCVIDIDFPSSEKFRVLRWTCGDPHEYVCLPAWTEGRWGGDDY